MEKTVDERSVPVRTTLVSYIRHDTDRLKSRAWRCFPDGGISFAWMGDFHACGAMMISYGEKPDSRHEIDAAIQRR
jgi:hypothetical protein